MNVTDDPSVEIAIFEWHEFSFGMAAEGKKNAD